MTERRPDFDVYAGDLFGEMVLADTAATPQPRKPLSRFVPGIAICAITGAAAAWFSEHYGIPVILMGLLLGLALNFVAGDPRTHDGLDFVSRTFLRWGIVVLGFQVTIAQIGAIGPVPFLALIVVMAAAVGAALLFARFAGQSLSVGLLAGGATAICGASAALALYGVIGRERVEQAQFALTLVGISVASALAMTVYPLLAETIGLTDRQAGFLIGASIHDVAQAIGGGFAVSDAAGADATVVKLTRVALLAPLVALASLALARFDPRGGTGKGGRLPALPWFILAFLGAVLLNSLVSVPKPVGDWALVLSKGLLLLAVTATAMRSRMDLMLQMGWRAGLPVFGATLASLLVALGFTLLVIK